MLLNFTPPAKSAARCAFESPPRRMLFSEKQLRLFAYKCFQAAVNLVELRSAGYTKGMTNVAIQQNTRSAFVPLCLATESAPETPVALVAAGVFSCAQRNCFKHPHAKYQQDASRLTFGRTDRGENGSSDPVSRRVAFAAQSELAVDGPGKDCQRVSRRWVQPTSPVQLGSLPNVSLASHGWSESDGNQHSSPGSGAPFHPGGRPMPHPRSRCQTG